MLLVLTLAVACAVVPVTSGAGSVAEERYTVAVDGETASGWLAYPNATTPHAMLVFGHGCCGTPDQSVFVRSYAAAFDAVVVAMDYRGAGRWDVMKGHRDLIAAAEDLEARFPSISRTVAWGLSMGGETTGMAVAARPDLFDYWVDTAGVVDLIQQFATLGAYPGPGAIDPQQPFAGSWIAEECGGTPAEVPWEYLARSPLYSALSMRGVKHVYITHGIGDLIVSYTQARAMFERLAAAAIPVSLYTTVTGPGPALGPYLPVGQTVPVVPTPFGPAGHDPRGFGPASAIVADLLSWREPDWDAMAREHVLDGTTARSITLSRR